jgi:hypothetical protein
MGTSGLLKESQNIRTVMQLGLPKLAERTKEIMPTPP